jgi:4-amino-4-deoxy-L-arabinose transferase-like glycosyltransferase
VTARRAAAVVALLIAAAVVFALPVGRRRLFNQDRYAMLAREVVDHSRWILPHVRGDVYLNKPPLFFWAVMAGDGVWHRARPAGAARRERTLILDTSP